MNKSRGFTIIELIVVIAIIAVLASIVLVNVTQYVNKGKNSAIKGNLSTLLTNSAVYFDTYPTTNGDDFIADVSQGCGAGGTIASAIGNAGGTLTCFADDDTQDWCGYSNTLSAGSTAAGFFCVDGKGNKIENGTACIATNFTCI